MLDFWIIDAVWITVAFVFGMIAKRINLPPLIGFLVGGFMLNSIGITEGGVALDVVANIGVMLLLFTIGLKLNIRSLVKKEIWLTTSIHIIISVLIFGSVVFLIGWTGLYLFSDLSLKTCLLIGFALSFSSTVFAVKVLEDRGEMNSYHGQVAIGILVMQDIFAVIFLSSAKGMWPTIWVLAIPLYLIIIRWIFVRILNIIDHGELLTLFGFFAAFVAGAMAFEAVGLKPDLGALIIGVLIGSHSRSKELAKQMLSFKDFFLIAFFLNIGMSGLPTWNSLFIALIFILLIPLKGILYMILLTRFNLRARTSWFSTLSLTNYSEFGLITGALGVQMGLIDNQWMIVLALSLSLSFVLSSPLNNKSYDLFDRFRRYLIRLNTKTAHPDDQPLNLGDAKVVICGMGRIGRAAYHQLTVEFNDRVIGIDYNKDVVNKLHKANKNITWGDTTDRNFWQNVYMPDVKFILLTMNDQSSNINTVKALNRCHTKHFSIAAPGHYVEEIQALKDAGVSFVYNYYGRVGAEFANSFMNFMEKRKEKDPIDPTECLKNE